MLITSESVAAGHPDKVADRISDAIVDACIATSPRAKVAVETMVTKNLCVIAGEVSGATVDYDEIARRVIRDLGYTGPDFSDKSEIIVRVHEQALQIQDVVEGEAAGDQGTVFGFACDETPMLMPAPIFYANLIQEALAPLTRNPGLKLGPDGKTQVTFLYEDGVPVSLHTVIVSIQNPCRYSAAFLKEFVIMPLLASAIPSRYWRADTKVIINSGGFFEHGGPGVDTGLTGRKIIVDTYGGAAPHGGGAFSGKDPSKIDRSGAYMARCLAKNVVASGAADKCLVSISYAFGLWQPVAFTVDCYGTNSVPEDVIRSQILKTVSLSPGDIIKQLSLRNPIYEETSAYGHFGRSYGAHFSSGLTFPWEKMNLMLGL